MGAFSTVRLTRSKAQAMFLKAVLNPTDEQMERLLGLILEDRLYNVRIVDDDGEHDDDRV